MIDIVRSHPSETPLTSVNGYELKAFEFRELLGTPPIDRDQLLVQCMHNVEFALKLLDQFALTSHARLDVFDTALLERDHDKISAAAHGLKGVAGILAANALMEVCEQLDTSSEAADWSCTATLIRKLHCEMRRMINFIPSVRNQA